jgi:ribosomal protein S18 acetylase RimI-like enzyme
MERDLDVGRPGCARPRVVAFARERGAEEVALGVADGNDAARTLYETYGFTDNGDFEPLASNPTLNVRYLTLK